MSGEGIQPVPATLGVHLLPPPPVTSTRAWFAALLIALAGGVGAVYPKAGIGVVVLALTVLLVLRTVALPVRGLYAALWILPWYPLTRAAIWCYYPNLPLFASRFWLEIILALMFAGTVFTTILRRERVQWTWHDAPMFLLLLSAAYGVFVTLVQQSYFNLIFGLYYSITPILAYFVVRMARPTASDTRRLVGTLLVTFALLTILSLADYLIHPDFMLRIYTSSRSGYFKGGIDEVRQYVMTVYVRLTSLLLEEDFWGALCSFVGLLCAARLATGRARRGVLGVFILAVVGLILSMSRGAIGGWAGGMLILVLVHRGRRLRAALVIVALVATLLGGYLGFRMDARVRVMEDRVTQRAPGEKGLGLDKLRQQQYEEGIDSFQRAPGGIGVGQSGFSTIYTKNGPPLVTDGEYFHILVEQGVVGLLLWAAAIPGILWVLWRRSQTTADPELRSLGVGLLAAFVGMCLHGVAANIFDYYGTPALFFIFFALFLSATDARHRPQNLSGTGGA